jgi:hypothetical protein
MKKVTMLLSAALTLSLLITAVSACGGAPEKKVKEPSVGVSAERVSEVAKGVSSGSIDVGTQYGLQPNERYHRIHATELALACTTCHLTSADTEQSVFGDQNTSPSAPGPVDRQVCRECHQDGAATAFYGSDSS